jgi:hypothetical protein
MATILASSWVLVPLFALLIPIIAIVSKLLHWWHGESERHATIRELGRAGQPIPAELLHPSRRDYQISVSASAAGSGLNRSLRSGIILLGVSVGLGAFLYLIAPEKWIWGVALIPGALGLANLVIARLEMRAKP